MDLLIGLLTFVLVLNCTILILMILIQLPKKEAGAGLAFGGAASDALFGAGTGTVLTKITRHATTFFLILALALSVMQSYRARANRVSIDELLDSRAAATAAQPVNVPAEAPVVTPTNVAFPLEDAAATTGAGTGATATNAAATTGAPTEAAATNAPDATAATAPAVETPTNAPAVPGPAEEPAAPETTPPQNP